MDGTEGVNNENIFPEFCYSCGSILDFDGIHLSCPNEECPGRIAKQLTGALKTLDIKGIGEQTIKPFAVDFGSMYFLIVWVYKSGHTKEIENYGIKHGSRSQEIFVQAFKNIKSLTYEQVIRMLGFDNVGRKISTQLAREHADLDYDYAHLEKALVTKLRSSDVSDYIKYVVSGLEELGISIDRPVEEVKESDDSTIKIEFTGSPKSAGFKTKQEFLDLIKKYDVIHYGLKTDTDYLITDSLESSSSKMKKAEKYNVKIITYSKFKEIILK